MTKARLLSFARMHRTVLAVFYVLCLFVGVQLFWHELVFIGCPWWLAMPSTWVCVYMLIHPAARDYYFKDFTS